MRKNGHRYQLLPPGAPDERRKKRIVRTVCIFQLLAILTCSMMLTSLWLMARLEASYNANEILVFVSNEYSPQQRVQEVVREESILKDPPGNRWSQRPPTWQKPVDRDARKHFKLPQSNQSTTFGLFTPLPSSLDYLGVMIDAGRHYFPPRWLYQQLQHLHKMGYNYIHFRLTDDQNFVLNLTIPNELLEGGKNKVGNSLAFVARSRKEEENVLILQHGNRSSTFKPGIVVYQPKELSKFVRFAKGRYNITVVPEINVPGHAGAWAANGFLPDLVVSCPEFSCSTGYGIPLNVTHPELPKLLKYVVEQVVEIFDQPPFLHLGGDELHMSSPCFQEAGIADPSSWLQESVPWFEDNVLRPILEEVGYGAHQILRWENKNLPETRNEQQKHRFGGITHYWETVPSAGSNIDQTTQQPFVISTGLYLDVLWYDRIYGYGDFQTAQKLVANPEVNPPFAIVVGTFELGMEFWEDRNVLGRLLAIRMGVAAATLVSSPQSSSTLSKNRKNGQEGSMDHPSPITHSSVPRTQQEFKREYTSKCITIFSNHGNICEKGGWPLLEDKRFQEKWRWTWKEWKEGLCEGLTYPEQNVHIKPLEIDSGLQRKANNYFWKNALSSVELPDNPPRSLYQNFTADNYSSGRIPNVGIAIDLVRHPFSYDDFSKFLHAIEPLGVNMIQINLANDVGQAVEYSSIPNIRYHPMSSEGNYTDDETALAPYNRYHLEKMAKRARQLSIKLVPEINLATNGGGWYKTGMLIDCPHTLCKKKYGIAFDVIDKIESIIPIVMAVILELRDVFSTSASDQFLHLGSDQREMAISGCFAEAGHSSSDAHSALHQFETKLSKGLSIVGIDPSQIIRWHNGEKIEYPDRAGKITHYTNVDDISKTTRSRAVQTPFFGTVILKDEMTPWDVYQETRRWTDTSSSPLGILAKTIHGEIPRSDQLLAFAMALGLTTDSEDLPTVATDFERDFETICARFNCTHATEPFGKAAYNRFHTREVFSIESCTDRTINVTVRKSRTTLQSKTDAL